MPETLNITIKNVVYKTPNVGTVTALSLATEISTKKAEIEAKNIELKNLISSLQDYNNQFMAEYILSSGSFPPT